MDEDSLSQIGLGFASKGLNPAPVLDLKGRASKIMTGTALSVDQKKESHRAVTGNIMHSAGGVQSRQDLFDEFSKLLEEIAGRFSTISADADGAVLSEQTAVAPKAPAAPLAKPAESAKPEKTEKPLESSLPETKPAAKSSTDIQPKSSDVKTVQKDQPEPATDEAEPNLTQEKAPAEETESKAQPPKEVGVDNAPAAAVVAQAVTQIVAEDPETEPVEQPLSEEQVITSDTPAPAALAQETPKEVVSADKPELQNQDEAVPAVASAQAPAAVAEVQEPQPASAEPPQAQPVEDATQEMPKLMPQDGEPLPKEPAQSVIQAQAVNTVPQTEPEQTSDSVAAAPAAEVSGASSDLTNLNAQVSLKNLLAENLAAVTKVTNVTAPQTQSALLDARVFSAADYQLFVSQQLLRPALEISTHKAPDAVNLSPAAQTAAPQAVTEPALVKTQAASPASDSTRQVRSSPRALPSNMLEKVEAVLKEAARAHDGNSITLRLDPPKLGSLKVDVTLRDGALHARLVADSPQVSTLLREKASELQASLRKLGLDVERVTVSINYEQNANNGQDAKYSRENTAKTERGRSLGNELGGLSWQQTPSQQSEAALDHWVA